MSTQGPGAGAFGLPANVDGIVCAHPASVGVVLALQAETNDRHACDIARRIKLGGVNGAMQPCPYNQLAKWDTLEIRYDQALVVFWWWQTIAEIGEKRQTTNGQIEESS